MSEQQQLAQAFADRVRETADAAGYRRRYESSDVPMVKAVEILEHFGWTFDWSGMPADSRDNYRTCWEAMAGEYYGSGKSVRDRIDFAIERADEVQAGVQALRSRALKMMSTGKDGVPFIFVVPAGDAGSQKKVCITVDPNYCPAGGNGKTAEELELGNDKKLTKGQVTSCLRRLGAVHGSEAARRQLANVIMPLISDEQKRAPEQKSFAFGFFGHN